MDINSQYNTMNTSIIASVWTYTHDITQLKALIKDETSLTELLTGFNFVILFLKIELCRIHNYIYYFEKIELH